MIFDFVTKDYGFDRYTVTDEIPKNSGYEIKDGNYTIEFGSEEKKKTWMFDDGGYNPTGNPAFVSWGIVNCGGYQLGGVDPVSDPYSVYIKIKSPVTIKNVGIFGGWYLKYDENETRIEGMCFPRIDVTGISKNNYEVLEEQLYDEDTGESRPTPIIYCKDNQPVNEITIYINGYHEFNVLYLTINEHLVGIDIPEPPKLVQKIELPTKLICLEKGRSTRITYEITPQDADNKTVSWSSSDSSVASINSLGIVTGNKEGTAIITCSAKDEGGATAEVEVEVYERVIIPDDPIKPDPDYDDGWPEELKNKVSGQVAMRKTFDIISKSILKEEDNRKDDTADIRNQMAWTRNKYPEEGSGAILIGSESTGYVGNNSVVEGLKNEASGHHSHAEGQKVKALGDNSHAEGNQTTASGGNSHAEGVNTVANGTNSHAEGSGTQALNSHTHTEGYQTIAYDLYSHAEGFKTEAGSDNGSTSGQAAHAEGYQTKALGSYSHAEGNGSEAVGISSHAGGTSSQALGDYSFAYGHGVVAPSISNGGTVALGRYNDYVSTIKNSTIVFSIGNGTSNNIRHNLLAFSNTGYAQFVDTRDGSASEKRQTFILQDRLGSIETDIVKINERIDNVVENFGNEINQCNFFITQVQNSLGVEIKTREEADARLERNINKVDDRVNDLVDRLENFRLIEICASLPNISEADKNTIYLVRGEEGETNNIFKEYIKAEVSSGRYEWELLGDYELNVKISTIDSETIRGWLDED